MWRERIVDELANAGDLGAESANFIRTQGVPMRFRRHSKSTGARWHMGKRITLNARFYSPENMQNNPAMLSLLVHEVHHLKQGMWTALSVYGELDAWQVGFRFYKTLVDASLHPAVEELLALPLTWERTTLRHAAKLMQDYAGKGYHINWLPLYPLPKEIRYWITRQEWR